MLSTMRGFAKLDREAWVDPRPLERLAAVSEREYIERRLTPGQRRFVALRIDEDLTHIEIAQRLGYSSPKVAEQTWNRIRERVRAITHAVASPSSQRASARATALADKRAAKEAAAKAKAQAATDAASGEAAPGAEPTPTIGGHPRGGMRAGARSKQSVSPESVTKPRRRDAPTADPPGRGSPGGSSGSPPLP